MGFNVNTFRSQLPFGGASPTKFQVDLTFPDGIGQDAARKVPFMVTAASLPATEFGVIQVPYFGRTIKIAGDRRFSSWTTSLLNDEDFPVRQALEQWHFKINSIIGNLADGAAGLPAQYKRDATVSQFSKRGALLRQYQFTGLFPVNTAAIQLDWGQVDTIERFDVTFEYDWAEVVGGNTGLVQG